MAIRRPESPHDLLTALRFSYNSRPSEFQKIPLFQEDAEMIGFRAINVATLGLFNLLADPEPRERSIAVHAPTGAATGAIKRSYGAFALDRKLRGEALTLRPNVGQFNFGDDHSKFFGNFWLSIDQALIGAESTRYVRYTFPENFDYSTLDRRLMTARALIDIANGQPEHSQIELELPPKIDGVRSVAS